MLIRDRQPQLYLEIRDAILSARIRLVPAPPEQAETAASARLTLGDCFAYALAKAEECPILTLHRDFLKTDTEVVLP